MSVQVRHKGITLLLLAAAQFMVILDATIVNVALPSIEKALNFTSTGQLQWIVTAYTILFGGFLLLGGRLGDLFGRRRIFLIGAIIFAIASLLGGLSQTPLMIIALRAVQGLGAALLSPAALSLLISVFKEGSERNRALGVWSAVAAGGGAVGLLLGGLLTQYVDWRWIFFINVPIALAIAFVTPRFIPESFAHDGNRRVDVLGATTVTAGLMALVYALVKGNDYGWTSGKTVAIFAGSVLLLGIFIAQEVRVKHAIVDFKIFKKRNITISNLAQLPIAAGIFSVFFYLTLYMQQILGYSPTKAGTAGLPVTVAVALIAGLSSRMIMKVGPRIILGVAPLVMAAGLFYLAHIPLHGHYLVDILPGIVLMGMGMGGAFVALVSSATSGVSHAESGLASGILNTSQQIGGAIGLAALTAVSTAQTKSAMIAAHGSLAAKPDAMVQGFRSAFVAAAIFVAVAALISAAGLKSRKHGVPTPSSDSEPVTVSV